MMHATPPPTWPFDQPPDCAVITLRSIMFSGAPILYVSHDANDDRWQFLGGGEVSVADAAVVGLSEIVERDRTLLEIADLPPGWIAWRTSANAPWLRSPHP